ncbi:MAG: hypothetical protein ACK46D_05135, partial [Roseiflexaceae bacterium]
MLHVTDGGLTHHSVRTPPSWHQQPHQSSLFRHSISNRTNPHPAVMASTLRVGAIFSSDNPIIPALTKRCHGAAHHGMTLGGRVSDATPSPRAAVDLSALAWLTVHAESPPLAFPPPLGCTADEMPQPL